MDWAIFSELSPPTRIWSSFVGRSSGVSGFHTANQVGIVSHLYEWVLPKLVVPTNHRFPCKHNHILWWIFWLHSQKWLNSAGKPSNWWFKQGFPFFPINQLSEWMFITGQKTPRWHGNFAEASQVSTADWLWSASHHCPWQQDQSREGSVGAGTARCLKEQVLLREKCQKTTINHDEMTLLLVVVLKSNPMIEVWSCWVHILRAIDGI